MKYNNSNGKMIYAVVLATIFGLSGGIVGSILARVYSLEKAFNIPLIGGVSYLDGSNGSNLIIEGARKIIIEQNAKVEETVSSAGQVIVGIFEMKGTTTPSGGGINDFYRKKDEIAQGFILTSDGWIISSFVPDTARSGKKNSAGELAKKYVAITEQKDIYELDGYIADPATGYTFWHMKGKGFPVRNLVNSVNPGQIVVGVNWDGLSWVTTVSGIIDAGGPVFSSDSSDRELVLADKPASEFYGAFVFDLNGGLVGVINQDGAIDPVSKIASCISCLLNGKSIERPFLGVYYIDLSGMIDPKEKNSTRGALIYKNAEGTAVIKGSPAEKAGLKEGDLIISVNNTEISSKNSLNQIVSGYIPGNSLSISYERAGEIRSATVTLESLK